MAEDEKPLSLLERMRQKAKEQKNYGGEFTHHEAKVDARTCPNCGAGRAQEDGLTHCAYCGFAFLSVTLSNGINIKKDDNSRNS